MRVLPGAVTKALRQEGAEYPHTPKERSLWKDPSWLGECGRVPIPLETLLADPEVAKQVRKAGLLRAEIICLRLYTGKYYQFLNITNFSSATERGCRPALVAAVHPTVLTSDN